MFLSQYAAKDKVSHPRAVYVREDRIVPGLDDWLAGLFRPGELARTVRTVAGSGLAAAGRTARMPRR